MPAKTMHVEVTYAEGDFRVVRLRSGRHLGAGAILAEGTESGNLGDVTPILIQDAGKRGVINSKTELCAYPTPRTKPCYWFYRPRTAGETRLVDGKRMEVGMLYRPVKEALEYWEEFPSEGGQWIKRTAPPYGWTVEQMRRVKPGTALCVAVDQADDARYFSVVPTGDTKWLEWEG